MSELVPEMLTLKETAVRSGFAYSTLRKMCINNEIVHIKVGSKFLINWNLFVDYLNGKQKGVVYGG